MPTYTPVNKTYTIWNKDPVNSVTINNFEFTNNANVSHHITYSSAWTAGAGAEWSPLADFTGNETLISKTKAYVSHVGDINTATAATDYFKGHTPFTRAYTTSSGDKLQVASTTTPVPITVGMAVTGGGYIGQTVTNFSATVGWIVLSAVGPTTLPAVGTTLTFTDPFPPTLKLVSTATLYTGMTMNGNGFTVGQTVVSIGADSTVVASADPNTGVYASAIVTFSPPQYVLRVNNITGLAAGWTTNSEFTYPVSRTVVSTSGTEYLIMSGDVGSSSPSGNIKFVSNTNDMITLAPNTSATWVMYYSANNSTLSNNIANIKIYATQQGNNVQKEINNVVSINQAPSLNNIQPAEGFGGGGGGGGYTVSSETTTFTSDLEAGYTVPSTMTVTTITDANGRVVETKITSTDASYGLAVAATDGVAQAAAAIGTNAATAASVTAAIATAAADAAAPNSTSSGGSGSTVGSGSATSAASGNAGLGVSAGGDGSAPSVGSGSNATCFVKGSKVTLANKTKIAIEDVKIGDQVLGLNGINTVTGYDRPMLIIDKVRSGTVYGINGLEKFVTSEHPILTDNGWKSIDMINAIIFEPHLAKLLIGNLEIGDKILTESGNYITVNSIEKYEDQPQQELYNLLLDGDHTFYLNDLLVHNKGDGGGGDGGCNVPWALIIMANGTTKEIQFIESGDSIQGFASINTVIENTAIKSSTRLVSFNNIGYFATEIHPFMTANGWGCFNTELLKSSNPSYYQLLKDDNNGNELTTIDENSLVYAFVNGESILTQVTNIEYKDNEDTIVYKLEVSGDRTFVVENIISHNKCFLGDAIIAMADGTFKNFEDLQVGDSVLGAFGEVNKVLALTVGLLGGAPMYKINGEHDCTDDEVFVGTDKQFYSIDPTELEDVWGYPTEVIVEDGSTEMWISVGLTTRNLHKATLGIELQTLNGGKILESMEPYSNLPLDTKIYNCVISGSHTLLINGYAHTGWLREDNFDYDKWTSTGIELTVEDYRNPSSYKPWTYK